MIEGIEKSSTTWRTLEEWIDLQVISLDFANRNVDNAAEHTLAIRVRIATLLEIRALPDPEPERPVQAEAVPIDAR